MRLARGGEPGPEGAATGMAAGLPGQRELAESTFIALAERTGTYPGLTGPLGRIYLRRGDLEKLEAMLARELTQA